MFFRPCKGAIAFSSLRATSVSSWAGAAPGAVEMIVGGVAPWLTGLPPFLLILAVYFIGLVLTEFLSNNAVAVIYTPIAIELKVIATL